MTPKKRQQLAQACPEATDLFERFVGSQEIIKGTDRYCLWIEDRSERRCKAAIRDQQIGLNKFAQMRIAWRRPRQRSDARQRRISLRKIRHRAMNHSLSSPDVTSERRAYTYRRTFMTGNGNQPTLLLPCTMRHLWSLAIIASRLHLVWIATVCGQLETRYSVLQYSRLEHLSGSDAHREEQGDLTRCAEDILLAREAHFPATIADLYDPETCPPICARRMSATTRCWSASISAAASGTTPSGWKSCSSSTRR